MRTWLRERLGTRTGGTIPGRPSWAYVLGWVLVFFIVMEAVTGAALAAFYSPSTTDAWASVAYIQDQAALGWLVRGLHHHGGGAIAIVAGLHLLQTAVYGAYKKPRELTWWLGLLLMMLLLAWAITGYVLRWDQAGYWANKVEIGIAAGAPIIGGIIRSAALGGNDYGNLTLTRFYDLHVIVLPALVTLGIAGHIWLAKRHGTTPRVDTTTTTPRWPAQTLRDTIAMAVAFAILLGFTISQHGAELAGPADPSQAFDARPLWYFRWLFLLRELAGSAEKLVAMVVPAVLAGILVALPLVDRGRERDPRKRLAFVGTVFALFAIVGALTVVSVITDGNDAKHAAALEKSDKLALRARALAAENGVPVTGALDVFKTPPMWTARSLYEQRCKSCHDAGSKDRKGPIIGPGHGDRAWLRGMVLAPSSEPYWGKTKLGKSDGAMKPVDLKGPALDELVEFLYAQSGATDVDAAKRTTGEGTFDTACNDCHTRDEGNSSNSPALAGLGSRAYYLDFMSNPKSALHMGKDKSEMPRFDRELSLADRDAIAGYLVWLRTATQKDLDALGPL